MPLQYEHQQQQQLLQAKINSCGDPVEKLELELGLKLKPEPE